jgi:hypothetical protein
MKDFIKIFCYQVQGHSVMIPAPLEAEAGGSLGQGHPEQQSETLSQKKKKCVPACNPSYSGN